MGSFVWGGGSVDDLSGHPWLESDVRGEVDFSDDLLDSFWPAVFYECGDEGRLAYARVACECDLHGGQVDVVKDSYG